MKKIIIILFCILFCISFTSCSNEIEDTSIEENDAIRLPEGPYVRRSAEWSIYSDAADLVNESDLVFIGKVTNIEFQVLDMTNALPVSETTEDFAKELYTIYTVEIFSAYKGDTNNISKVRVMGGMVDYNVEEQLSVMEIGQTYNRELGIPIWDYYQKIQCAIGNSYLFVLKQFDTGYPTIINLEQAIFDLADPMKKRTIGNNTRAYYSGTIDEYNNPLISVNDIIEEFGSEKLHAFNKDFENGVFQQAKQ
ncbi:MAG: hypothetical protein E7616_07720 [Ruminococcaceae bacterium]|nr:hypothetical protein [Oscillospiraceae bacterium]